MGVLRRAELDALVDITTLSDENTMTAGTGLQLQTNKLKIDSRKIESKDTFLALKGLNHNGHDYILKAIANGADKIIVERDYLQDWINKYKGVESLSELAQWTNLTDKEKQQVRSAIQKINFMLCEDSIATLGQLAATYRSKIQPFVLVITGSNGKTSARSILENLFKIVFGAQNVSATTGNFNNHIGLPLTILAAPVQARYLILELGMNHPGEIKYLAQICRPHVALITSISAGHIGFFKNLQQIAQSKLELMQHLVGYGKQKPLLLLNEDDQNYALVLAEARKHKTDILGYSKNLLDDINLEEGGYCFGLDGVTIQTNFFLEHQLSYVAGFKRILAFLKQPAGQLKQLPARIDFVLPAGRFQLLKNKKIFLDIIDDTYNANLASMITALKSTAKIFQGSELVAVLGEMAELGVFATEHHLLVGQEVAKVGFKHLYAIGSENALLYAQGFNDQKMQMQNENEAFNAKGYTAVICDGQPEFFKLNNIPKNAVYLVKGSRGAEMEKIVKYLEKLDA